MYRVYVKQSKTGFLIIYYSTQSWKHIEERRETEKLKYLVFKPANLMSSWWLGKLRIMILIYIISISAEEVNFHSPQSYIFRKRERERKTACLRYLTAMKGRALYLNCTLSEASDESEKLHLAQFC